MNLSIDRLAFQQQYAKGRIVNLGCSGNPARLQAAMHVDERPGPFVDGPTPSPFLLADIKHTGLPDDSFDTAVMGEVLEHANTEEEALAMLREAHRLAPSVVITVPRDDGLLDFVTWQVNLRTPSTHRLWIEAGTLWRWLEETGWDVKVWIQIDYGMWPCGWCVWAKRKTEVLPPAPMEGRIPTRRFGL